jgi:uncharacterized membrane protein
MNYKNTPLFLAAAAVTIFNFQSCSKYDDNSGIHLKSKKSRLTGEWEVVKINGQSPSSYYGMDVEMIYEVESDGDLEYSLSVGSYSYSLSGEWEWEDNKEAIKIEVNGSVSELEIKKLTNKEMTLEDSDGDELEFEKQ